MRYASSRASLYGRQALSPAPSPQNTLANFDKYLKLAPPRDLEIARAAVYKEVPPKAS